MQAIDFSMTQVLYCASGRSVPIIRKTARHVCISYSNRKHEKSIFSKIFLQKNLARTFFEQLLLDRTE